MGLKTQPAYIGQTGYLHPVELDRNLIEGMFQRSGMTRVGEMAVTPTGVSGQISVAAGRAFLLGVENASQGGYFVWSDGADLLSVAAASGNPRIDTLVLRVKDDQYGTISGSPAAYYEVVQGVAAGSPTARADSYFNSGGGAYVPGAWFRVADILRNLGDGVIPGGQITSNLRYVRTPGGVVFCTSSTRPSDAIDGDMVYETDTTFLMRRVGGTWRMAAPYKQTNTLGGTAASVTFSSIPTSLKNIRITWLARADNAVNEQQIYLRINGDSGANYRYVFNQVANTAVTGVQGLGVNQAVVGYVSGSSTVANSYGVGTCDIMGWNGPHSAFLAGQAQGSLMTSTNQWNLNGAWHYFPSGPYTSIQLLPQAGNFVANSQFTLEGWD